MQAMSMGLPVIASDVEGVNNMIRPGVGILVSTGDVNGLANSMAWFLDNPDQAADFAARAREKAQVEYSILKVVEQYEGAASTIEAYTP